MNSTVWVVVLKTVHVQGNGYDDVEFHNTTIDSAWDNEADAKVRAVILRQEWHGDCVTSLDDIDVESVTLYTK